MRNKDTDELMIFACEQNALVDVYAVETNEDCFVIVSSDPSGLDIKEFKGMPVEHRETTREENMEYRAAFLEASVMSNVKAGLL